MSHCIRSIASVLRKLTLFFCMVLMTLGASSAFADHPPSPCVVQEEGAMTKGLDSPGNTRFTIPLYQNAGIRYFSAGVGVEERRAIYPPFPLKLMFVAGSRAYVAHVSITIQDHHTQKRVLDIPADRVTGPWLFLDLPPGMYTIVGRYDGQPDIQRRVTVDKRGTANVMFRWPSA